ncbi:MAG: TetR/AcrR family transcriptional regulator [Chloroflexota bacterium]
MGKVETKKRLAIQSIAAYLLEKGLHDTGIRRLAQAAGTSDRMLIYYFGSKDELLNQTLGAIAAGVTEQLDALLGTHPRPASTLLAELTAATAHPSFEPAIQLWFELVGLAARGKEPYASNAQLLASNWVEWINSRLEEASHEIARDLYAHLEGRVMLKVIRL